MCICNFLNKVSHQLWLAGATTVKGEVRDSLVLSLGFGPLS